MHDGCANTYSVSKGRKHVLVTPLSPFQEMQEQLAISKVTKKSLFANKGEDISMDFVPIPISERSCTNGAKKVEWVRAMHRKSKLMPRADGPF